MSFSAARCSTNNYYNGISLAYIVSVFSVIKLPSLFFHFDVVFLFQCLDESMLPLIDSGIFYWNIIDRSNEKRMIENGFSFLNPQLAKVMRLFSFLRRCLSKIRTEILYENPFRMCFKLIKNFANKKQRNK